MARSDAGAGKLDTSDQVGIVFQPNGQFALLQALEGGSIKLVHHDGHVDTVTVVAFPSGFLTTLPHFQSPSVASDSITLDVSPSTSPLSSPTLSSPSTAPSSSLEVSSSQPISTLDTSTSPAEIPITSRPPSLPSSIHIAHNTSAAPSPGSALTSKVPAYVGTAFGSLVAFATLCAFVSFCIRLCRRRRRRKNAAELPWAQRKDSDRVSDWNAGPNLMPASTKASVDRDVGEPRRSDGYGGPPDSLHGTRLTGRAGLETMFDGSAPHGHKPTLGRHLPSHLVDKEFSALAMPPVVGQVGEEGELGTPREDVVVPRYLSLKGDALELPWATKVSQASTPQPPPPRSTAERLRRASKPVREGWTQSDSPGIPERPMPNGQQHNPEGWAGSITSNLVNAFNAVAANIATFKTDGEGDVMYTPKPLRQGTMRNGTQVDGSSDIYVGCGALDRRYGADTMHSSVESNMPWTLEEVADGAGIVHIRISPSKPRACSRSTSSHYSSDSPPPTIPFVASHLPQPAVLKNEVSHHYRPRIGRGISRGSSQTSSSHRTLVSSATSDKTVSPTRPLNLQRHRKDSRESGEKDKLSPSRSSLISRLSSTSSATSWSNSLSSLPANNKVAEALRARKRAQYLNN